MQPNDQTAPAAPPPDAGLNERIRQRHYRVVASIWDVPAGRGPDDNRCRSDGDEWPCDTIRLVEATQQARALYASGLTDDMSPSERRQAAVRLRDAMRDWSARLSSLNEDSP